MCFPPDAAKHKDMHMDMPAIRCKLPGRTCPSAEGTAVDVKQHQRVARILFQLFSKYQSTTGSIRPETKSGRAKENCGITIELIVPTL